jgi:hypothetical protein
VRGTPPQHEVSIDALGFWMLNPVATDRWSDFAPLMIPFRSFPLHDMIMGAASYADAQTAVQRGAREYVEGLSPGRVNELLTEWE